MKKPLKISEFKFDGIFGGNLNYPNFVYCLLGSGFFRTPSSDNADSLIKDWLKKHPDANVFSVSAINSQVIKIIYCWVIDGQDTLNNFLIKNGCFPGGTMIRPKTWDEMDTREKELYDESDEKPNVKVFVDKETYENFIEQIKSAELYARENKLGVWSKDLEE